MILIDTNILVFAHNADSAQHEPARRILREALEQKLVACVTPQNLLEFYSVITNPRRVSSPLAPDIAHDVVRKYLNAPEVRKIFPSAGALDRAFAWARTFGISGADVFDAFLAATCLEYGISTIYTDNPNDFTRFEGLQAVNPLQETAS